MYIHIVYYHVKFEWDENKNLTNITKHGISFELAQEAFKSIIFTAEDTRKDYGEKRYISIGEIDSILVVVAIHTERDNIIRIISARKANKQERQIYYEFKGKVY